MLDVQAGDEVFGMDGKIYRIVGTSDVMLNHRLFDVEFDDGVVIRADADHRWLTFTYAERMSAHRRSDERRSNRRATRPSRGLGKRPDLARMNAQRSANYTPEPVTGGVRTTLEIRDTLYAGGKKALNHSIPVAKPLELPDAVLPVDPYVLGFWLGDGNTYAGRVTIGDMNIEDSRAILALAGYPITKIPSCKYDYTVKGLQKQLKLAGVFKNKHIPELYLFASFAQRLALLQGLMDTDGYACKDGQCEFYSSRLPLIESASRLLHTLGIKHAIRTKKPPKDTHYNESYRIKFVAPFAVFRLAVKADRQNMTLRSTQKWRYIVDVREVDSEPVKCIAIDSPDHLYLAGEACIPTHNTDLLLGLAGTSHKSSVIFRRIFPSLRAIIERSREVYNSANATHSQDSYNESLHLWRLIDGRTVELSSCQLNKDKEKQRGRPRDFYGFDEVTEFTEEMYRFITAWNRTTDAGQRCRIVSTGNPPTQPEGDWVKRYWGHWLDACHPNPAMPGELVWFVHIDDKDTEVGRGNDPPPAVEHNGVMLKPRSRTFIPARLGDNPYLKDSGYEAVLMGLPEPLRSQMLFGDFSMKMEDHPYQIIPNEWVDLAQQRWTEVRPDVQLQCIGVDPARGGKDKTAIALKYGDWYQVHAYPGKDTPDGASVAQLVVPFLQKGKNPEINVDVIGVGSSPVDMLLQMDIPANPLNASSAALDWQGNPVLDRTEKMGFSNQRAQWWWQFREALDPENGSLIALPPDPELKSDLCAPRWKLSGWKIAVEPKAEIKDRIGRSPDKGEAIIYASVFAGFDDLDFLSTGKRSSQGASWR